MKRNLIYTSFAIILFGFLLLGVQNLRISDQKIHIKKIEIQDLNVKLKLLNEKYNDLLHKSKTNKSELKELREEKEKLEKQLRVQNEKERLDRERVADASKLSKSAYAQPQQGSCQKLIKKAGITDVQNAFNIIMKESGCNYLAVNKSSGAYGLCQSLPANKMASAGSDWRTNPMTQLRWCNRYAQSRYGSWQKAWTFWQRNHWW